MRVCRVEEMREMDRRAIEGFAVPEELLMENAGAAAFRVVEQVCGVRGKRFALLCGTGNNGGDGMVVARKIHSMGGDARVFILGDSARFKGAAATNFRIVSSLPVTVKEIKSAESLKNALLESDAIVDAIFGTGLTRKVEGLHKAVIERVNRSGKRVFSLDIPSGINGDTGCVMGVAIKADATITFGLPKVGNLLYPGWEYGGSLFVSHISFPPELTCLEDLRIRLNSPVKLPPRGADTHKGDFGDVLFIAGSSNYYGAPLFSAYSFLKAGGGYSRLAAPASIVPVIAAQAGEIVFLPQEETGTGSISSRNSDRLLALSNHVDMVVMGPGLSLNDDTQDLVRQLAIHIKKPLLIDGDGITAISGKPEILARRGAPTVLTPHAGELSRLAGRPIGEILLDRTAVIQAEAAKWNAVIVSKGAHSLIAYPDGRVFVNLTGNSGMATAGSGDVLAGSIAAMFGLGLPFEESVRTGVFIHGLAGDMAAATIGKDGVTAGDLMNTLPSAMRAYREGFAGDTSVFLPYSIPVV